MYSQNYYLNLVITILLFPLIFQKTFFDFAIGYPDDLVAVTIVKWIFLLLPCLAFIAACWITVACLITLIFRYKRLSFVVAMILTWWDFFKSVLYYWGGIFKAILNLFLTVIGLFRMAVLTIWSVFKDIIFLPGRLLIAAGRGVTGASVPWIAVSLTLLAACIEALIFTPIITPVVQDILPQFGSGWLQVVLFFMLFMLVLASFAVLSITLDTVKKKQIGTTIMIIIIELVVITVEVMFLYREFVDALVPWFAQYQENFELGALGTILIAFVAWVGVRSLVWFLFASHGAPVIMSIIQGRPLAATKDAKPSTSLKLFENTAEFFTGIKANSVWIQERGNDLLNAILLPPLQVLAATINFLILLFYSKHMFKLPFRKIGDIRPSSELITMVFTPKNEPGVNPFPAKTAQADSSSES